MLNSLIRLVVIISISGLRPYDIETYSASIGDNGFKRLMQQSTYYNPNAICNYMTTSSASFYATMTTGATPNMHGIVGSQFYSVVDNGVISCIDDARYPGINSKATVSPRLIGANTITDQLKALYPNSKVYAIATNPESAIMMGGHLGDAAVWIDTASMEYATSTYYAMGLPTWAMQANKNRYISETMATPWQPMVNISLYHYPAKTLNFWNNARPTFLELNKAENFMHSPMVNEQLTKLAIRAIRDDLLGTDESPDMVMLEYTLNTPFGTARSAEVEDAFIRLDQDIASLLNAIDISVGLGNTLIVLTAPPAGTENVHHEKLSYPEFNNDRAMALLNSYLMALYGQGQWVNTYYNRQIYLNHTLIDNMSVPLNEIQDKVAAFMLEFSTIQTATAAHTLAMPASAGGMDITSRMANSVYKHRSGDVILTLRPGATDKQSQIPASYTPIKFPLLIFAPDHELRRPEQFTLVELCPTLSRLLCIPAPHAASRIGI